MTDHDIPLQKSPHLQAVSTGSQLIIWHSLFGHPQVISAETLRFLEHFAAPKSLNALFPDGVPTEIEKPVQALMNSYFLIHHTLDERVVLRATMQKRDDSITSGSRINYLELIMSEACNFRCTYCIHFNNLETSNRIDNPKKLMRFDRAKQAIDEYLQILRTHKKKGAEINFGGGEPLLAWPVIRQVLEYCTEKHGREFTFRFSVNTNASLITHEIAKTLKLYSVSIATSLDGLQEGNDKVRLTKAGRGTFDAIMDGFAILASVGYPIKSFAVTVNEDNFANLDSKIIDWAAAREMTEVRIDIDVIGMIGVPIGDVVQKLIQIRTYARTKGIEVSGFWLRAAENLNESTLLSPVAFCGAVRGNSMCVGPSGNIYGCGYSTTTLGSLTQIRRFHAANQPYHQFVQAHQTGTTETCKGCMIEGQCAGGCNITQEFARATGTAKIERMCEFYRSMTQEILKEQLRDLCTE